MTQSPSPSHTQVSSGHYGRERVALGSTGRAIGFYAHLLVYLLCCLLLLVVTGFFPALIVALSWGIGLGMHGFFALLVPALRATARTTAPDTQTLPAAHGLDAQRARSLEELSAAIAHEIRNPITAAKSLVQQIAEDPTAADSAEHARVAVEELDRVERSIAHLLRFAREEPFEPTDVDVNELIESAIDLVRDRAERQHVHIERDIERLPSAFADGEQLRKVIANLISNALDAHAQQPGKDPFVKISAGRNLAGDELWIRITDNGPGIGEAERSQVFRPFYTGKAGGTGLGLALARKVLARHGGSIELVSQRAQGAEFLLLLPRRPHGREAGI
jgi:signal transduction histidine kinase